MKSSNWHRAAMASLLLACASTGSAEQSEEVGSIPKPAVVPDSVNTTRQNVLGPLEAKKVYFFDGDWLQIKVRGAQTNGAYEVIEDNFPRGFSMPVHKHLWHEESFYVVAGEMDFTLGDEVIKMTTGMLVHVPRGTPHRAQTSTGTQVLTTVSPAFLENFMEDWHSLSDEDKQKPGQLEQFRLRNDALYVRD